MSVFVELARLITPNIKCTFSRKYFRLIAEMKNKRERWKTHYSICFAQLHAL